MLSFPQHPYLSVAPMCNLYASTSEGTDLCLARSSGTRTVVLLLERLAAEHAPSD